MEHTTFDVIALGELLVDFTQTGVSAQGNPLFEANPGGAPANVLAMLSKLGKKCAFVGKVGRDGFGDMLADTLAGCGIETRSLLRDEHVPTTLAMVRTLPGGDRDFSFYRKPGADIMLSADELDVSLLRHCRILQPVLFGMRKEITCFCGTITGNRKRIPVFDAEAASSEYMNMLKIFLAANQVHIIGQIHRTFLQLFGGQLQRNAPPVLFVISVISNAHGVKENGL